MKARPKPAEIKAWGASQSLTLLVRLERLVGDASRLRPWSKPFKLRGTFVFVVAIYHQDHNGFQSELDEFVRKQSTVFEEERKVVLPDNTARLRWLGRDEILTLLQNLKD